MVIDYFSSDKVGLEDKKTLLSALTEIPISSSDIWWQEKLEQWRELSTAGIPQKDNDIK
jgi:hypothetical protein